MPLSGQRTALLCIVSLCLIVYVYLAYVMPKPRREETMTTGSKSAPDVTLSNVTSAQLPSPSHVIPTAVNPGVASPHQLAPLSAENCLPYFLDLQAEVNPLHPGPFTPEELQRRFGVVASPSPNHRQRQLRQGCSGHPELWATSPPDTSPPDNASVLYVSQTRTSFCLVEKAGSTFFKQILFVLYSQGLPPSLHSPFQVDFGLAHGFAVTELETPVDVIRRPGVRNVVVVRNPWSRLYSAYVSKFFLVNCPYWQMVTENLHYFRSQEARAARPLGHDITFAEFVRYVIDVGHKFDPHFMPLTSHACVSCDVRYAHIVRLESVGGDLLRLLEELGEAGPRPRMYFSDMKSESELYNVVAALCQMFDTPDVVSKYLSPAQALGRVWRYMQLAGNADLHHPLPPDLHRRPHGEVFRAFFEAFQSRSKHRASRQRSEAKRQAFLTLSDLELRKLKDIYQADFDLFGYEAEPAEIFQDRERKRAEAATQFQYFDLLQ